MDPNLDPNLVIDDDYVHKVGNGCKTRGVKLEEIIDSYIVILNEIKNEALIEGDISDALGAYIECVTLLNDQLRTLSENVKEICLGFITDVNEADSYLF